MHEPFMMLRLSHLLRNQFALTRLCTCMRAALTYNPYMDALYMPYTQTRSLLSLDCRWIVAHATGYGLHAWLYMSGFICLYLYVWRDMAYMHGSTCLSLRVCLTHRHGPGIAEALDTAP